MKIEISDKILQKYNLNVEEFMVLYINCKNKIYTELKNSIIAKGLVTQSMANTDEIILTNELKQEIDNILLDSAKTKNTEGYYISLAKDMQALYPKGKKAGTTYSWRGSVIEIMHKLKTLEVRYGAKLDRDKVLNATKKYVESFNGDYKYMSLLKYFIIKYDKVGGECTELKSQLMSLVENEGQQDEDNNEWIARLQ